MKDIYVRICVRLMCVSIYDHDLMIKVVI